MTEHTRWMNASAFYGLRIGTAYCSFNVDHQEEEDEVEVEDEEEVDRVPMKSGVLGTKSLCLRPR